MCTSISASLWLAVALLSFAKSSPVPPLDGTYQTRLEKISARFQFATPKDALPDFSFAGYASGSAPLPSNPNRTVIAQLEPAGNSSDRTADLQAAVDKAAAQGGGIVALTGGDYYFSSTSVNISSSGIVIRGCTNESSPTRILVSGPIRNLIQIGSPTDIGVAMPQNGSSLISQAYVPLGATSLQVDSASAFTVGQSIIVRREVNADWVKAMEMNNLIRDGKKQTWIKPGTFVDQEREITAIDNKTIYWQVPITDPIDQSLANNNASVIAFAAPPRISKVGVEYLTFVQPKSAAGMPVAPEVLMPIVFGAAEDSWARNISATGFNQFTKFLESSRRITLQDFVVVRDQPTSNGGKGALPIDVTIGGTQILVLRGTTLGDSDTAAYIVATSSLTTGPNVISGYIATGCTRHTIEPHQRWATGFLVERSVVGRILMGNRGILGSGQGWSIGTGIVYSSVADNIRVENPPTSANFQINSFESPKFASMDAPRVSLYQTQLANRINCETAASVVGGLPTHNPLAGAPGASLAAKGGAAPGTIPVLERWRLSSERCTSFTRGFEWWNLLSGSGQL